MSVEAIKPAGIDEVAGIHDLDKAARYLQDIAGITTGDIAGICLNSKDWAEADKVRRVQLLELWLKAEASYEVP